MTKKILIFLSMIILVFMFTDCGKYSVRKGSELDEQDMRILQKPFNQLTYSEQFDLDIMQIRMSEDELIDFKDDLKRLYIEEMTDMHDSKETAEEMFEKEYDYTLRKKQGKLTDEELKIEKQMEQKIEELSEKVLEYIYAEEEIQTRLDEDLKNKHDGYLIDCTVVGSDSISKAISIEANVVTLKDITAGQIIVFRNEISQTVFDAINAEKVVITLKLNNEDKGTYTFTRDIGWDKQVEP